MWNKIKDGELKGLSIEGYFINKMEKMGKQQFSNEEIRKAIKELLSVQKIELGAIDDFEKQFEKAMNDTTADKLITDLRKAEVGFEKVIKEFDKATKLGITLIKAAKDLGVDLPKTVTNKIDSSQAEKAEHQKYLSKISAMYNMF
jgi:hypothetical protein